MTQRDLFAGDIREKPMWRLTPEEIESLSKQEQVWVRSALYDMQQDGTLAMLRANKPGTVYRVDWDRNTGWYLKPACTCAVEPDPDFIAAYFEWSPLADGEIATERTDGHEPG